MNTQKGVRRLLNDYHHLKSRKVSRADYTAADILIDLEKAIELANLTDRQRQATYLHFIKLKTQEETALEMDGITQVGVHYHIQGALKRIAAVYRRWNYGEVTMRYNGDSEKRGRLNT